MLVQCFLFKDSLLGVSALNLFGVPMSQSYTYPDCVYFDANIISMIVEHSEWYRPLFNFLFENHFCIAVSDALLVELSQVRGKQADFNTFFTLLPSAKIKSFEAVIEEEVKSYPKMLTDTLTLWPANSDFGKGTITSWLISDKIKDAQRKQLRYTKKIEHYIESVKSNFSPLHQGRFNIEQAEIFAWMFTVQWLKGSHPEFMKKLNNDRHLLNAEVFPSIQLFAYYVYYQYYSDSKQLKALSDFDDLFNLFYFPYCKLIVLERNVCSILNRIKSHCKLLGGVEVSTLDFFGDNRFFKK
jgi:hypothetical protein